MKSGVTSLVLLASLVGVAFGQGRKPGWEMMGAAGQEALPIPSLQELFLDISSVLARADATAAGALRTRIDWTSRRIAALERVRTQLTAGVALDLPEALLSPRAEGADTARLAALRRDVERLHARYDLARLGESTGAGRTRRSKDAAHLSTLGAAVLRIQAELPPPPDSNAGSEEAVRKAADKEQLGRSLQLLGDQQGALNAFAAIDEKQRTAAVWYRMGQCAEALERWKEAEGYYQRIVKLAPDKVWGEMARQRLEFGKKLQGVAKDARGNE